MGRALPGEPREGHATLRRALSGPGGSHALRLPAHSADRGGAGAAGVVWVGDVFHGEICRHQRRGLYRPPLSELRFFSISELSLNYHGHLSALRARTSRWRGLLYPSVLLARRIEHEIFGHARTAVPIDATVHAKKVVLYSLAFDNERFVFLDR